MSVVESKMPVDWPSVVAETERRNGTVELQADEEQPGRTGTALSRLLHIDANGQWLLEKPYAMHGPHFSSGTRLIGVVSGGTRRLSFRASVIEVELFQLNRDKQVPVIRISPPTDIQSAQRRAYYRVSAVGVDILPAKLWPIHDPAAMVDIEKACEAQHAGHDVTMPIMPDHDPILGELLDISGNGLSLLIEASHAQAMAASMMFRTELHLPGDAYPLVFVVRRIRLRQDQASPIHAAFTFEFAHHKAHQRFITDAVCRFTTAQQRLQLQRKR